MTISQKMAISYAVKKRADERRRAFIIEKEGDLSQFKQSKYKSMHWYILSKYNERIY